MSNYLIYVKHKFKIIYRFFFFNIRRLKFGGLMWNVKTFKNYNEYLKFQKKKTLDPVKREKWLNEEWDEKVIFFYSIFEEFTKNLLLNKKSSFLCIGARTGQEVFALRNMGFDAIGIDLVKHDPYVVEGDMHKLPFEDNKFDVVFSNIMDHSLYPNDSIKEMERVTKIGGYGFLHLTIGKATDEFGVTEILSEKKIINFFKNSKLIKSQSIKKLKIAQNWELILQKNKIEKVINLAAQAGVRYSLINPKSYIDTNISGFFNLIDLSRKYKIKHFIYASTSSVYGLSKKMPFKESSTTDHPIQLYAATKKSNELIAHSYSYIYKLPTTGLRFFTVYGPWGRPDMALFKFTKNILSNKKIDIFNFGDHSRDFTYIDDIVQGIVKSINKIPKTNKNFKFLNPKLGESSAPFTIYNIGNGKKVKLLKYISEIEKYLNKDAKKNYKKLQKGDIKDTHSNLQKIKKNLGYKSKTSVKEGVKNFLNWYLQYYKIKSL